MKKPKRKDYKVKKCKICETEFKPFRFGQKVCSPKCASDFVIQENAKKAKIKNKKRKQDLKTNSQLLKEAQREFNKFIRLRDKEKPCISCGRLDVVKWDAGHYRSVGAASHLRFNEDNCHKQCARPCNSDLSGNILEYRKGLIERIGLEKVEKLEADNGAKKFKRDEILQIKSTYAKKARELEKQL